MERSFGFLHAFDEAQAGAHLFDQVLRLRGSLRNEAQVSLVSDLGAEEVAGTPALHHAGTGLPGEFDDGVPEVGRIFGQLVDH